MSWNPDRTQQNVVKYPNSEKFTNKQRADAEYSRMQDMAEPE